MFAHLNAFQGREKDLRRSPCHSIREAVKENLSTPKEASKVKVFTGGKYFRQLTESEGRKDLGIQSVELGSQLVREVSNDPLFET